jgi:hemerythrin-like domain-containing protein
LTVHAQIEEEIFYPACHEHVEDAEDLLAEAKVEHQTLKELIAKIEKAKPGSEEFDAEVKVLGEYVKHHVKEEQNELFPKVRKSELDLTEVGEQLATRKEELQAAA